MIRLALAAIAVIVAYHIGRDVEWRAWVREADVLDDEMSGVQPADPYAVAFTPQEAVELLTRDWGTAMRDEWTYNR